MRNSSPRATQQRFEEGGGSERRYATSRRATIRSVSGRNTRRLRSREELASPDVRRRFFFLSPEKSKNEAKERTLCARTSSATIFREHAPRTEFKDDFPGNDTHWGKNPFYLFDLLFLVEALVVDFDYVVRGLSRILVTSVCSIRAVYSILARTFEPNLRKRARAAECTSKSITRETLPRTEKMYSNSSICFRQHRNVPHGFSANGRSEFRSEAPRDLEKVE